VCDGDIVVGCRQASESRLNSSTSVNQRFPRNDLQAMACMGSDHCALILQGDTQADFNRGFRFESFWIKMPGFMEAVKDAWDNPVNSQDPLLVFHVKLLRTAKALKIWRRRNFSNWKLRTAILQLILLELEKNPRTKEFVIAGTRVQKIHKGEASGSSGYPKEQS